MVNSYYKVPRGIVITVISALIISVVSLVVYFEKRQDADIKVNTRSLQSTVQEMMKQDKAIGIIANDAKNHKENKTAHAK
jgi:hypothetical protein